MKKIIISIGILTTLISCNKQNVKPNPVEPTPPVVSQPVVYYWDAKLTNYVDYGIYKPDSSEFLYMEINGREQRINKKIQNYDFNVKSGDKIRFIFNSGRYFHPYYEPIIDNWIDSIYFYNKTIFTFNNNFGKSYGIIIPSHTDTTFIVK